MKRSDLVKLITDKLFYGKLAEAARSDVRPKFITDMAEADAEAVLKEIEHFMIPMPDLAEAVTGGLVYCYYDSDKNDDLDRVCEDKEGRLDIENSQLWEPEDDE